MHLTSDDFLDGATIPARFTCDGEDLAPSLRWTDPPAGTLSFALIVDDPDAPGGVFHHWGVFDIPPSARHLGEEAQSLRQARNDFRRAGYSGPCPPRGHGVHRYRFRLLALDKARLALGEDVTVPDIERAARPHLIESVQLVGRYKRR